MRGLEEQLGLQLLTRTTRNVSPTEAGERLLRTVAPHFDGTEEASAGQLAQGPDSARMHQSAPADIRGLLCLGVIC
jgi:DNA-binding transcriptional LysR family regulator